MFHFHVHCTAIIVCFLHTSCMVPSTYVASFRSNCTFCWHARNIQRLEISADLEMMKSITWCINLSRALLTLLSQLLTACNVRRLQVSQDTWRDVPLDWSTVLENVLDASHVPFTHHKSISNRNIIGAYDVEMTSDVEHGGFTGAAWGRERIGPFMCRIS